MTNSNKSFVLFCFNYPYYFIEDIWEGNMAKHLREKFERIYNLDGRRAVMVSFYVELGTKQQEELDNFISNWAAGNC